MSTESQSDTKSSRELSDDHCDSSLDSSQKQTPEQITQQGEFSLETGNVRTPESAESTLDQFGVEVSPSKRETKTMQAQASSILRDDRPEDAIKSPDRADTEQADLFPDVDRGQQTLTGDTANQCLFGQSTDTEETNNHQEESSSEH